MDLSFPHEFLPVRYKFRHAKHVIFFLLLTVMLLSGMRERVLFCFFFFGCCFLLCCFFLFACLLVMVMTTLVLFLFFQREKYSISSESGNSRIIRHFFPTIFSSQAKTLFEMPTFGDILPTITVKSARLYPYTDVWDYVILLCQLLFALTRKWISAI